MASFICVGDQRKGSTTIAQSWSDNRQSLCPPHPKGPAQGPVEFDHAVYGGIRHLEKLQGTKGKCLQSTCEVLMFHPVKCCLLLEGKDGE